MFDINKVTGYTIIESKKLPEQNGTGYLLRHDKSGARVLFIDNDEENKVFCIGFRTPPENSKGVQHIIEHTVLCGSKKYPVKDPFVELCKSSLNTFLNAMTYPDKTLYPVASCNDKDYQNLMDVYLDAVFNPNIYDKEEIFKQEGWHYEMESADAPLTINGVVYNEMKGVYSSADSCAGRAVTESLYPDSIYCKDSGGAPDDIPSLTREEYLQYHSAYYHPSNSYIYLYGNIDFNEKLEYLDMEYLSKYEKKDVDSTVKEQKSFDAPRSYTTYYAVSEDEELEGNTYLTYNTVIGKSTDVMLNTAFDILCYTLLDAPGAPLKKAIVDTGICAEVDSNYEDEIMQPEFSIIARNSDEGCKETFINTIEGTLRKLVEEGLDKRSLAAAVNHFEFKHKESNFGRYPKGLILMLDVMGSWLYDENEAFTRFSLNPVYEKLRENIDTGYFEDVIRKYILDNPHKTYGVTKPDREISKKNEEKLTKKLEEIRSRMTAEEIEQLVKDTAHLKAYQEEPSPEEDLEKIPVLEISDIKKEARKLKNRETEVDGVKVVQHEIFTNGISYMEFTFDTSELAGEEIGIASLLCEILKYVDTDNYSEGLLSNEIDTRTGGIAFGTCITNTEAGRAIPGFYAKMKCFDDKVADGIELVGEILYRSHITDKKRLKEIIAETKANIKTDLLESGHVTAGLRAASYLNVTNALKDKQEGIDYYRFLDRIDRDFDKHYDELAASIKTVLQKILKKANLTISFASEKKAEESLGTALKGFVDGLSDEEPGAPAEIELKVLNEGFTAASQVQYCAAAADFKKKGLPYSGALNILRIIFGYDYLWINVRVKGGAYGCAGSFSRSGVSLMTSYRDPNLKETYDIFSAAAQYVENFDANDRDMTKYIIGTIGSIDTPLTPQSEAGFSYACYLAGITDEQLQRERDEILNADSATIRSLAPYVQILTDSPVRCAVGNEDKVSKATALFDNIDSLYAGADKSR
ncbi:MAG: insulinase family protein [Eubacterium sp.]|nr:insulinase family protein [Eubacterium sp.]